jgi:hypothetical protein
MNEDELELATNGEPTLTDWNKEPSYNDLNTDRINASTYQETLRSNLKRWEEYRDGGKKITPSKPGKSTVRPKLIRKQNEWKYPSLEEPFLSTPYMYKINPRTEEDANAAMQNQILLNYQWSSKINKVKLVGDIVRTIVDEGTVVVKTGWESEEGIKLVEEEQPVYASPEESLALMQQAVQDGSMSMEQMQAMIETGQPMQTGTEKVYVEKEVLIKNQPTYEVCNNANIIIDPTCEGIMENAQFVIHEYSTSMSELKKQEYRRWTEVDEETGVKETFETGIYKNLSKIKDEDLEAVDLEYDSESAQNFKYKDGPRKKVRAFEYWGYWDINGDGEVEPIIATWVGKTIIRMEKNPFPHKRLPFSIATYMPIKKECFGEPDAELLIENQESIGKMMRAAHDITANNAIGQEFIDEGLFPSPVQRDNYNKGNTVYFRTGLNPKTSIYKNGTTPIDGTVFNMISMQNAEAESLSGTKAFSTGISGQTFGSVATGVRSAMDAVSKRELSILRRISDLLFKDMARMTIAMNQSYLDDEEIIRITNKFVTIRRDDLAGEFDLIIEVSTPERDNETAQDLGMILQTNAASMDPKLANMVMAKIMDLKKQPDLAEYFRTYEPQPDPVAEQIKQLELENATLVNEKLKKDIEEGDSKIHERISRVIENETDVKNKESQRLLREAQTRKLESESDMIDKKFVDEQTGATRAKELEDKAIDARLKANEREHSAELEMTREEMMAKIRLLEDALSSSKNKQ